ncbi:MbtH family protein [Acuticoccus sp. 2012]|uniref:MbtH family protein n=2 Tax=Acuticoccus mangrovi TaxID=2796142 RepID=A0A934ITX2_9HYPH|nr:MbtH family protein [Acuticoccus mangrovi]
MNDDTKTNPFDDERYAFAVLTNAVGQYSLWPTFRSPPSGWTVVFGPAERSACFDYVEDAWTDLLPSARPADPARQAS